MKPLSGFHQIERLQAERRKGGVAATNAVHEKLASTGTDMPAAICSGERCEKTDRERAADVHQQSAPGKRFAKLAGHNPGKPKTRHAADRPADCNPQIRQHLRSLMVHS